MPQTRWLNLRTEDVILWVPFLDLTRAASRSGAKPVWWRCISPHAWVTALFPARAQVSVSHVCLQTALRCRKGRVDPATFVLVGIRKSGFSKKPFKDGVAHKQAEIYPTINHGWCWPLLSIGSEARQQTLQEGKEQTADTCLDPPSFCATFQTFHLSTFWQAHVCFSKISALPGWPTLLGLGFVLRLHRTSTSTLWCNASC